MNIKKKWNGKNMKIAAFSGFKYLNGNLGINFNKNLNKSNPINFKGSIEESKEKNDSDIKMIEEKYEKQKLLVSEKIDSNNKRISYLKDQIKILNAKIDILNSLDDKKDELDNIIFEYLSALKKMRADEKRNKISKKYSFEMYEFLKNATKDYDFSSTKEQQEKDYFLRCLSLNMLEYDFDIEKLKSKLQEKINEYNLLIERKALEIDTLINGLDQYHNSLKENYKTAAKDKPIITIGTKDELLDLGGACDWSYVAQDFEMNNSVRDVINELKKMGLIKTFKFNNLSVFIDLTDEATKETMDFLKSAQGKVRSVDFLCKIFKITPEEFHKLGLKTHKFVSRNEDYKKTLELADCSEIQNFNVFGTFRLGYYNNPNMQDSKIIAKDKNADWKRTKCLPSKYYVLSDNDLKLPLYVPSDYLDKLGFCTSSALKRLILQNKIDGKIESKGDEKGDKGLATADNKETNDTAYVDISKFKTRKTLMNIRENNPYTISFVDFSKASGVCEQDILLKIAQGELDIIPEGIFSNDGRDRFIDLRIKKNRDFIQKTLLNRELIQKMAPAQYVVGKPRKFKERKELFEKILWHCSKNTLDIAQELYNNDKEVQQVFSKKCAMLDLSPQDQEIVDNYCAEVWNRAKCDEFLQSYKKAISAVDTYFKDGIDAIKDIKMKKVIVDFYNGLSEKEYKHVVKGNKSSKK